MNAKAQKSKTKKKPLHRPQVGRERWGKNNRNSHPHFSDVGFSSTQLLPPVIHAKAGIHKGASARGESPSGPNESASRSSSFVVNLVVGAWKTKDTMAISAVAGFGARYVLKQVGSLAKEQGVNQLLDYSAHTIGHMLQEYGASTLLKGAVGGLGLSSTAMLALPSILSFAVVLASGAVLGVVGGGAASVAKEWYKGHGKDWVKQSYQEGGVKAVLATAFVKPVALEEGWVRQAFWKNAGVHALGGVFGASLGEFIRADGILAQSPLLAPFRATAIEYLDCCKEKAIEFAQPVAHLAQDMTPFCAAAAETCCRCKDMIVERGLAFLNQVQNTKFSNLLPLVGIEDAVGDEIVASDVGLPENLPTAPTSDADPSSLGTGASFSPHQILHDTVAVNNQAAAFAKAGKWKDALDINQTGLNQILGNIDSTQRQAVLNRLTEAAAQHNKAAFQQILGDPNLGIDIHSRAGHKLVAACRRLVSDHAWLETKVPHEQQIMGGADAHQPITSGAAPLDALSSPEAIVADKVTKLTSYGLQEAAMLQNMLSDRSGHYTDVETFIERSTAFYQAVKQTGRDAFIAFNRKQISTIWNESSAKMFYWRVRADSLNEIPPARYLQQFALWNLGAAPKPPLGAEQFKAVITDAAAAVAEAQKGDTPDLLNTAVRLEQGSQLLVGTNGRDVTKVLHGCMTNKGDLLPIDAVKKKCGDYVVSAYEIIKNLAGPDTKGLSTEDFLIGLRLNFDLTSQHARKLLSASRASLRPVPS